MNSRQAITDMAISGALYISGSCVILFWPILASVPENDEYESKLPDMII